jgi:hypothetical protein
VSVSLHSLCANYPKKPASQLITKVGHFACDKSGRRVYNIHARPAEFSVV